MTQILGPFRIGNYFEGEEEVKETKKDFHKEEESKVIHAYSEVKSLC